MLDKKFYTDTYKLFHETHGEEFELRLCIEEMSELTQALCKYLRHKQIGEYNERFEQLKQSVIEECADVIICAEQVKLLFGEAEVEKVMDMKIQRGRQRTEEFLSKGQEKLLGAKNEKKGF